MFDRVQLLFRTRIYRNVRKFRAAAEAPTPIYPQKPPEARIRLAAKLIMEEAFETVTAMYGSSEAFQEQKEKVQSLLESLEVSPDMPEVADGLGDLDYVSEFARQEFGIDGLPIQNAIQKANMAKFGPGSWVREDGKRMKPEGWEPPDIKGELLRQGWAPPEDDRNET